MYPSAKSPGELNTIRHYQEEENFTSIRISQPGQIVEEKKKKLITKLYILKNYQSSQNL